MRIYLQENLLKKDKALISPTKEKLREELITKILQTDIDDLIVTDERVNCYTFVIKLEKIA